MIQLSTLHPNPNNPGILKDAKFKKLVQSLKAFPRMMELRFIVIDENNMVIAGNQRLKALQELGYKEVPDQWIKQAIDFTPAELQEFILKDNEHAGEFDFEMLTSEYEIGKLEDWGIDLPAMSDEETMPKEVELKPYQRTHILLSFPPEKMIDLQPLLQQITAYSYVEYEQANN